MLTPGSHRVMLREDNASGTQNAQEGPMNPPRKSSHAILLALSFGASLALVGCTAAPTEHLSQYVYEVTVSEPGGEVSYRTFTDAERSPDQDLTLDDRYWAYSVHTAADDQPHVSVTAPEGASAECRILHIEGSKVTVVSQVRGGSGVKVSCEPDPQTK